MRNRVQDKVWPGTSAIRSSKLSGGVSLDYLSPNGKLSLNAELCSFSVKMNNISSNVWALFAIPCYEDDDDDN